MFGKSLKFIDFARESSTFSIIGRESSGRFNSPRLHHFSLYCQVLADSAFSRGHFGIFWECSISRRHSATKCGKTKKRDCTGPIWVTGSLHCKKMRKALGIRNWEAAEKDSP
jgi:hypothetical protein